MVGGRAEREDALLGARLLFVAARPADDQVEAMGIERLLQGLGLHDVRMDLGAVAEWSDALRQPGLIGVDDQVEPQRAHRLVAKRNHLAELPGGIDVQQRERRLGRVERLHRQMQKYGAILADGVHQHRLLCLGGDFAQDVDALGFEPL